MSSKTYARLMKELIIANCYCDGAFKWKYCWSPFFHNSVWYMQAKLNTLIPSSSFQIVVNEP